MKSISKSWIENTNKLSYIENLSLEGNHLWKKCRINSQILNKTKADIMISLLANGSLVEPLPNLKRLRKNNIYIYEADINEKVPLILCGFIIPKSFFFKVNVVVTITGFYEEGF